MVLECHTNLLPLFAKAFNGCNDSVGIYRLGFQANTFYLCALCMKGRRQKHREDLSQSVMGRHLIPLPLFVCLPWLLWILSSLPFPSKSILLSSIFLKSNLSFPSLSLLHLSVLPPPFHYLLNHSLKLSLLVGNHPSVNLAFFSSSFCPLIFLPSLLILSFLLSSFVYILTCLSLFPVFSSIILVLQFSFCSFFSILFVQVK